MRIIGLATARPAFLPLCQRQRFRQTSCISSSISHRRSVWHSGYMDEQRSQEIAKEIETKRDQLRQVLVQENKFPPIFLEKEQELTRLYEEYECLTGEPLLDDDHEDGDKDESSASAVTSKRLS